MDTVVLGPTSQAAWRPALPAQGRPPPSCEEDLLCGQPRAQLQAPVGRRSMTARQTGSAPGGHCDLPRSPEAGPAGHSRRWWQARVEEWGIPIPVPPGPCWPGREALLHTALLIGVHCALCGHPPAGRPPAPFPNCDRPGFCVPRQLLRVCWTHCFALTSLSPKQGLAQTPRTLARKSGRYTNGEGKGEGAGATPASRPSFLVSCFTTL